MAAPRRSWAFSETPDKRQAGTRARRSAGCCATGILLIAGAALLGGCGAGGAQEDYREYLTRLARTLSVAAVTPADPSVPALPPPRALHLDLPPGKLDALDFLAISGCAVQVTIGKRNSSLGRMARPSQRLLLDLEYLRLAPQCIAYQRRQGEQALAATLQEAWDLKRSQLPSQIFNATLGGEEYRAFWRAPLDEGDYPADTGSALLTTLEQLNAQAERWLQGDYTADNLEVELLLGQIANGDGGALLRALARQGAALAAADHILAARSERGPLCSATWRPPEVAILDNVVRRFFIGAIQPRAAALNRRYHQLLPPVTRLERLLDAALPPAYRAWRADRDELLADLVQSPRRHVQALQALQRPCAGELPAGPGH